MRQAGAKRDKVDLTTTSPQSVTGGTEIYCLQPVAPAQLSSAWDWSDRERAAGAALRSSQCHAEGKKLVEDYCCGENVYRLTRYRRVKTKREREREETRQRCEEGQRHGER